MLKNIDRLQIAVPDRSAVEKNWTELLGAEPSGEDRVACLAAKRTRLRLGNGYVELLEPDGVGPVADAVGKRGAHLFSPGATTDDVAALVAQLRKQGIEPTLEGNQAYLGPDAAGQLGIRLVLSPDENRPAVGEIDFFYETTLLVANAEETVRSCAQLFALDEEAFVPISSAEYGYSGVLTLFDRDRLGRFEVITPNVPTNTMGRFFARFGESFYMCFAESHSLSAIESRASERGVGFTMVPPKSRSGGADTLFLHASTLGGVMLGISRRTQAWQWSGHPERVEARS